MLVASPFILSFFCLREDHDQLGKMNLIIVYASERGFRINMCES